MCKERSAPDETGNSVEKDIWHYIFFIDIIIIIIIIIIIVIIIKKDRQWKAERQWYTPYQSEDPSRTIPTYTQKEEKGKNSRRL